ncbi:MAG: type I-G CRISPR-associated helicase/endonuclease Cas3g, partial [Vulcanimicrobiaceae bacterium]
MPKLGFDEFFLAITGDRPFAWQSRLADRVLHDREGTVSWPALCDLPTSSGKTAILLIALYTMLQKRNAHIRIAYAVNRRILVDNAFTMMDALRKRLQDNDPALATIRDLFVARFGNTNLEIHLLRGGTGEPLARVDTPTTPTFLMGTIDQLGSRLLFRGYGVGSRYRSIPAGLLAFDTLWIVDEAHVSQPFMKTLRVVEAYAKIAPLPRPLHILELTATPSLSDHDNTFSLGEPDERIAVRLNTAKPARIDRLAKRRDLVPSILADARTRLRSGARRIGIIVNRISTAREIFEQLAKNADNYKPLLLMGPVRPYDAERITASNEFQSLLAKASDPPMPIIAVCTQTVEIGADLDFDTLLTESAPIDVLRQRFGRLDRIGRQRDTFAKIYHVESKRRDPIYGAAIEPTIEWLEDIAKNGCVDFGITAIKTHAATITEAMRSPVRLHEPLLAPHVARLVQTWPDPFSGPDVEPFLHGEQSAGDVQVVWRGGLDA